MYQDSWEGLSLFLLHSVAIMSVSVLPAFLLRKFVMKEKLSWLLIVIVGIILVSFSRVVYEILGGVQDLNIPLAIADGLVVYILLMKPLRANSYQDSEPAQKELT